MTPDYFGLTADHTWLSVDEQYYKKLKPTHRMVCHPAPKQLSDEEIKRIINAKWHKFNFQADYVVEDEELIDFARAIIKEITNE